MIVTMAYDEDLEVTSLDGADAYDRFMGRFSAVRWGVAGNIVSAWLLTLPAAGLVAAGLFYPVRWIF